MIALFQKAGDLSSNRHGRRGARMHDGERRNRIRVMRRFKNIVFKFDEAGGKAAHKGIAGPGGVDHFYFMRADAEKDVRLGDKTAASA